MKYVTYMEDALAQAVEKHKEFVSEIKQAIEDSKIMVNMTTEDWDSSEVEMYPSATDGGIIICLSVPEAGSGLVPKSDGGFREGYLSKIVRFEKLIEESNEIGIAEIDRMIVALQGARSRKEPN